MRPKSRNGKRGGNRREYKKAVELDANSLKVKMICVKNENGNPDIMSSEVIDIAARLFQLAAKRGRVKSTEIEVYDEAV